MNGIPDRMGRRTARGGAALAVVMLAACGGGGGAGESGVGGATPGGPTSRLPAARSALVPPDQTYPCTITRSAIERFDVKGSGLAFGGARFGDVGTYTYTLAEATATVASADDCAGTIVDLKNAVPDAAGNVRYRFDVVLLAPTDAARANGTLFYEVTNRTRSLLVPALNEGSSNDLFATVRPQVAATASGDVAGVGAGNGFLMNQGASIVWAGWQGDQPQTLSGPTAAITTAQRWYAPGMSLPVAVDRANGDAPITGRVQDELVPDSATANLLGTYYRLAPGSLATATLTVRRTPTSAPVTVARPLWTYTAGSATAPAGGTGADGQGFVTIDRAAVRADAANAAALDGGRDDGSIYQFDYTAVGPRVMGLGFLATRDLVSFLRHGTADAAGNRNPLAGRVRATLFGGISQSGRYVRDFLWQGFNADAQNRRVFDGMFPLVGGSRKTYTNYRWSKPGDYSRQHETHYTPGDQFPFGYATLTDPLSGRTDGLLAKCTQDATCPKVVQYDSPIEFGGARASLVATDGAGNDVAVPDNVRLFYANGTQHSPSMLAANARTQPDMTTNRAVAATAPTAAPNVQNASTALVRALYLNLEGWVNGTAQPLASVWPSARAATLAVPTASAASLGGPDLSAVSFSGVPGAPGLAFNGVYNTLSVNDERVIPSVPSTKLYVVQLPTVDAQGNDVAGVKMPDAAVPLATFKGYSLRRAGFVAGDQYGLNGSQLAFAVTDAQRQPGDPRRSVQGLYGSRAGYVDAVDRSVADLVARGLMLDGRFGADDAAAYRARARSQGLQPGFAALP
ncbi:MAG TPA: alpha/beta hydrolase domain-containing protein [Variovorax sp.]|nr:alpha/beta hydrolase domain-containing protein [Variovorax sp.]